MNIPIGLLKQYLKDAENQRAWAIKDGRAEDIEFITKLIDKRSRELRELEASGKSL